MNDGQEETVAVAYIKAPPQHFAGVTEDKRETSVSVVSFPAKI
jgi:hypothetical protein